jgi:pyrimidine-nucleoside phosphorylase
MVITDIIAKKRDGGALQAEEIAWVVDGLVHGVVSDAQMAALLMAIVLRGMDEQEATHLTLAMTRSGETLDLSSIPGTTVDKHSTGGVGDKTTLVVAPLAAALGVPVPKMSGRALGHTGGTIDKLECLPGLRTDLSPAQFVEQVSDIGVAIAAQSARMAPADKRLYALRDATATVESVPLIASSVMSKKLAVGAQALVLDVKVGEGALLAGLEQARALARTMVDIGTRAGQRVVALLTAMDQPLGAAVGDALEVIEAIETLQGRGPADFTELCETITGYMLWLGSAATSPEEGRTRARTALAAGAGLAKLRQLVHAQGGEVAALDTPSSLLAEVARQEVRLASRGWVTGIDARAVGVAVRDLKAAAGPDKARVGVLLQVKGGEEATGRPVATVIAPPGLGEARSRAAEAVARAYQVGVASTPRRALLQEVVT